MKTREIKVQEHILPSAAGRPMKIRPKLIILGKWLEDAGIYAGDRVTVTVVEDQLIINRL
jgi:hypothetical protein